MMVLTQVCFDYGLMFWFDGSELQVMLMAGHAKLIQWFSTFFIRRHTIKLFKFSRHTDYIGNNKKVFT